MKTASAKAKGRKCAKEVKELILEIFPDLHSDDIIITSSCDTGEDLKLSPKARNLVPLSIECKNQEKLNIWSALEQAESNAGIYQPTVFFRRNRSDLYVAMNARALIELIKLYHDEGEQDACIS